MLQAEKYPNLNALTAEVLRSWPRHGKFVDRSMAHRSEGVMRVSEQLSGAIIRMSETVQGGLPALCADYRYTSEKLVIPEEFHFKLHGEYRLKSFEEANRECYSDPVLMGRYMNGLAVSDVMWGNHAAAVWAFIEQYLPGLKPGTRHLEVGPGHGFFLYFAAADPKVSSLTGWDVSPTSIEHTRHVLDVLGVQKDVDLKLQNLYEAGTPQPGSEFDSIVISEVLEHLEDPGLALRSLLAWLRPGGRIWINVPINAPAPDHIYLLSTVEDSHDLVRDSGYVIEQHNAFPMSGMTLEDAIREKQAISSVITAIKPV